MNTQKAIRTTKITAKVVATLIAGFILFMFVGESLEDNSHHAPLQKNAQTILKIGQSQTIKDTIKGGIWYSVNPKIATVDSSKGVVTAIETGTVRIVHHYSGGEQVYIQPVDVHFSSTVILLSMMAFYWLTLVLILWKERLFSILNIAALIIQMAGIVILNHVALNGIMLFLIGAVPAVVILICNAIEKDSNNANIQPSEK
jgi:hypothetical protein